jgi:hypothetical protein
MEVSTVITLNDSTVNPETITDEELATFDYISQYFDFTRQPIIVSPAQTTNVCRDNLAVDEFVELLKKKLSSDPMFKDLLLSTKSLQNDYTGSDPHVAMFVSKIYSKKEPTTTTKMTESDYINSTLLANLVEAVIFRAGGMLNLNSRYT